MRNLGILLLIVAWVLLGWWMCTCYCAACCEKEPEKALSESTAPLIPAVETPAYNCPDRPICFPPNSCEPTYGSGFASLRDSIVGLMKAGQKINITGLYGNSEQNSSEYDNLGTCRASAVKTEFAKVIDANSIDINSQLTVGQGSSDGASATDKIRFTILEAAAAPIETSTLIYFPFNSTNKLSDSSVEDYLDSVADRVKSSGERVRLTGHTDDIGSASSNQSLGQKRAEVIRDYLTTKGVSSSKIITQSRGESAPVATNATESGRAKNRRTELQIIN